MLQGRDALPSVAQAQSAHLTVALLLVAEENALLLIFGRRLQLQLQLCNTDLWARQVQANGNHRGCQRKRCLHKAARESRSV